MAKANVMNTFLLVGVTEMLPEFFELLELMLPQFFCNITEVYRELGTCH